VADTLADRPFRQAPQAEERHFLGTGWAFPPSFDGITLAARMVRHEDDVRESLHILLGTAPGERVMHPSYGCGLRRLVFETLNQNLLTEMRSVIEKAVLFFETRITLEEVDFELPDAQAPNRRDLQGVLLIKLSYTIRATNTRHNMVYPMYLEEGNAQP
jgi:uncharacterized protein